MRQKKDFLIFLIIHFFVWTLIPLLRGSLPLDSVEAIAWGQLGGWVTDKHPPLSGFLANLFFKIFRGHDVSIYILSQLCVVTGFIYIYKIARIFLNEKKSVLSAILLEGTIYYTYASMEFNVNIITLALWPMTIYYFYLSTHGGKVKDWFVLSILITANVLNKYSCIYLFLAMFTYLLATKNGREQFKNKELYGCGFMFLLLVVPHLWYLYKTNFFPLEYLASRSKSYPGLRIIGHIIYPIRFILSQLPAVAGTLVVFFVIYARFPILLCSETENENIKKDNSQFLICLGMLPLLFFTLTSAIAGTKLRSMWGSSLFSMLGILLFYFLSFEVTDNIYKKAKIYIYATMCIWALAAIFTIIFTKSEKYYFPRQQFVEDMTEIWREETNNAPLKYVKGEIWYASQMSIYQEEKPKLILNIDKLYKNLLNKEELNKYGVMIFGDKNPSTKSYSFEIKNIVGRKKEYTLYYNIVPPNGGIYEQK